MIPAYYCAIQTRAFSEKKNTNKGMPPTALVRNLCVVLQKHLPTALSVTLAANAPCGCYHTPQTELATQAIAQLLPVQARLCHQQARHHL